MGDTLGPLVDTLLRRIRDTGAVGTSRAHVRRFLAHAEGLVGIGLRAHIETFTFTSTPTRTIYDVGGISPRIGEILNVRVQNKDLAKTALNDLASQSPSWFREQDTAPLAWAPVGRDLFVLWPGTPQALSITLVATAMPLAPDDSYVGADIDTLTLDSRWTPFVQDWAEVLLLLRSRRYDALKPALERLKDARTAAAAGVLV